MFSTCPLVCPSVRLSVRSFVRSSVTNLWTLLRKRMNSRPGGSGGQEVKVTGGRTYVRKPGGDIILYPLNRVETKRHAISDGNVAHRFNCTPPPRLSICVLLTHLFADRYLGNSDTDRREILHDGRYGSRTGSIPYWGRYPQGIPKIQNFGR